jgi:hypothetical protein
MRLVIIHLLCISPFSTRAAVLGDAALKRKKRDLAELALITVYEEIIFHLDTDPILTICNT